KAAGVLPESEAGVCEKADAQADEIAQGVGEQGRQACRNARDDGAHAYRGVEQAHQDKADQLQLHFAVARMKYCAPIGIAPMNRSSGRKIDSEWGKKSVYRVRGEAKPASRINRVAVRESSNTACSSNGHSRTTLRVTGFHGLCSKKKNSPPGFRTLWISRSDSTQ